jgi:hypothetical protein
MGRSRLISLLAAGALATLAFATPASAYTPGTSSDFFGVNAAYLRNFVSPSQSASLNGLTTSMGQQGISWARITLDQSVEERTKGTFDWYVPDTMIASLARHGVRAEGSFVGTASWAADSGDVAACGHLAAPSDVSGWSQWVRAATSRYGPNGTFWSAHPELTKLPIKTWEIGNEVNSGIFWCPAADPEGYAAILSASAGAIRAVDSTSQVMVGGLAPRFGWQTDTDLDVPTFLSRMLAASPSLATSISAVAIHPYAATGSDALATIQKFRRALRTAGLPNTPMVANEIGWYTQGQAGPLLTTDANRATQISTVANQFWRTDRGVQGMAPYSWITLQQDPSNSEDWYGLADPTTGAPNAGGLAYGQQIKLALGQSTSPPPTDTLNICGPKSVTVQKTGSGSITSAAPGIDCGSTCTASFDDDSQVTLTATPSAGYLFGGWSGCDSVSGNECTVTANEDRSVSANFIGLPVVSVQKSGSGSVTSGLPGIDCGAVCSASFPFTTQLVLTATPASGYAFRGWTGCSGVNGALCWIAALQGDQSITANFVAQRTLTAQKTGSGTITSSPAGINCGTTCSTTVDDGSQITLIATAASGSVFRGWSGCTSTSGSQCTVTMGSDKTVSASFVQQRTLTAQRSGAGTIASSPEGISCGSACSTVIDDGTQVTLTGTPMPGYALRSWSGCDSSNGDECTVTMSADRTATATFVPVRSLTVQKSGSGSVSSSPTGIDCGATCAATFDYVAQVTLTATPATGYSFGSWTGCTSVSGDQCTVSMSADTTVQAEFVPVSEPKSESTAAPPDTRITTFKVAKRGRGISYKYDATNGTGRLTFSCRIDKRPFGPCFGLSGYATPGRHTFQVVATDELGRTDPSPATRSFRIRRR